MPTIPDLPEVRARHSVLSVEAYEVLVEMGAIGKHAELIRGVVINTMPKSSLHCTLTKLIFRALLARERPGLVAFSERPLRLADSMPEPDGMMVRGSDRDYLQRHPTTAELVVEVAVSSAASDRELASLYAEARVKEYWIVLAHEQRIEVYRQPENGVYRQTRTYSIGEMLICESVPGLVAPLADWFA